MEANTSPKGITSHQYPFVNQGITLSKYACDYMYAETILDYKQYMIIHLLWIVSKERSRGVGV